MCAADITSDLAKMEPEVIFISSRNITVQWSSDHVCPSLLEGYNITYCRLHHGHSDSNEKLTCAEKPITHLVPSNRTKFLIKKLHPHSTYQIQMVMYSKVKYGKLSDVLIVNTTEEGKSQQNVKINKETHINTDNPLF